MRGTMMLRVTATWLGTAVTAWRVVMRCSASRLLSSFATAWGSTTRPSRMLPMGVGTITACCREGGAPALRATTLMVLVPISTPMAAERLRKRLMRLVMLPPESGEF